jgi:Flp pilus assembly protein TadB
MATPRSTPTPADAAAEVASLSAGLGIITMALFPFALPGILLFVVLPLILLAAPLVVLGAVLVPLVLLARVVMRAVSRRRGARKPRPAAPRRSPVETARARTRPPRAA